MTRPGREAAAGQLPLALRGLREAPPPRAATLRAMPITFMRTQDGAPAQISVRDAPARPFGERGGSC